MFVLFPLQFQHLHKVLVAEINSLQGMAALGQRPLHIEVSANKMCRFDHIALPRFTKGS